MRLTTKIIIFIIVSGALSLALILLQKDYLNEALVHKANLSIDTVRQLFTKVVYIVSTFLIVLVIVLSVLLTRWVFIPLSDFSLSIQNRDFQLIAEHKKRKDEFGKIFSVLDDFLTFQNQLHLPAELLEEKNRELEAQNLMIQTQSESITSGLRYAKTMQEAVLPNQSDLDDYFESFIIYLPRDIVSGDFYWISNNFGDSENYKILFATMDCTGHGVPGAFMTFIGITLLNDIVNVQKVTNPAIILNKLDKGIIKSLKQDISQNNDGMEGALCLIHKKTNNDFEIEYCGAKSDVFYRFSTANFVQKLQAHRFGLGGISQRTKDWENSHLTLAKNDMIYWYSDGVVDICNPKRDRFGTTRFVATLQQFSYLGMSVQKTAIESAIQSFQAGQHQRDDITVVGMMLK